MDSTSNEKIAQALELLEAAAREKKDELRELFKDRYSHLASVLMETERSVIQQLFATLKEEIEALVRAKNLGQEKVQDAAIAVDDHVHGNPWPYIGAAAAVSLVGGYLMGSKTHCSHTRAES